jgi:hypothetical protein
MRRAFLVIALFAVSACKTANSDDWSGGAATPFKQAERSCTELAQSISQDADRRDFFIGCMGSLGWSPRAGASVDL